MREIKFRAWDTETNTWLEGVTYTLHTSGRLITTPPGCILMQYTGLKDSKGKEIYEGDIILVRDSRWMVAWHRHENSMIGWMVKDDKVHHWYEIDKSILRGKVIGNIYENPELLPGK